MTKINLLIILILSSFFGTAQVENINPDKNAEPWIVGGLRIPSQEEINKIPVIKNLFETGAKDLPSYLDNSNQQYFRPIFSQTDGCCAQASGIAYNFTYEMNRERGTSANTSSNQFPTHYTYNFLNGGSGSNGSWFWDGWEIIKANGCPTVSEYGGLAQDATYWMSGYDNYMQGQDNRVTDIFAIDVNTPEGLETLKHWMFDHLEGDADGSIVNFAAGVSDVFDITDNDIIIEWGHSVNHAMTFVGWDDNIEYDFSGDGNITNNVDINDDGIVDMRDWERGALIMVNSWGTYWGDGGKAYVMYKLLAEPTDNGGIFSNKVYSIKVKETYTPQLTMKVKMEHNSRNKIKIYAGVSENVAATTPDNIIEFPLFNKQGGDFDMRGTSTSPIEITFDITPLLSYVNSGTEAKFFLLVDENDGGGTSSGQIYDYSMVDNNSNETVCASHNVTINNNDVTVLSVNGAVTFDAPVITTSSLPVALLDQEYSQQLNANGGQAPYTWAIKIDYNEETLAGTFPTATTPLIPNDNDDGYAVQTIDFDFPFYGVAYNQLYISTDGSIIFEDNFTYLRSEDAIKGAKAISIFASDLMIYPADGDGIFYEGDGNSATFSWKTSLYAQQDKNIEVAIKLYPSGEIEFFYNEVTDGLDWAAGISNGDRTNYVIASNSGNYNPDYDRVKFRSSPFPSGMSITSDGIFEGIPTEENFWKISFVVTDYNNISKVKELQFITTHVGVDEFEENKILVYPNPFNSAVEISYSLTEMSSVNLRIFDITGKCIETLINENQSAGNYKISWKPEAPSGLYLYQLEINGYTKTGKLIFQ